VRILGRGGKDLRAGLRQSCELLPRLLGPSVLAYFASVGGLEAAWDSTDLVEEASDDGEREKASNPVPMPRGEVHVVALEPEQSLLTTEPRFLL